MQWNTCAICRLKRLHSFAHMHTCMQRASCQAKILVFTRRTWFHEPQWHMNMIYVWIYPNIHIRTLDFFWYMLQLAKTVFGVTPKFRFLKSLVWLWVEFWRLNPRKWKQASVLSWQSKKCFTCNFLAGTSLARRDRLEILLSLQY